MPIIYHVTSSANWSAAKKKGFYEHSSIQSEGFIHCSQDHQVAAVLERYFAGQSKASISSLLIWKVSKRMIVFVTLIMIASGW
jgi:uncharacterized protein (DUF952 family)